MALSAQVGSITCPASTGNQATTGVGFQPKAILFWSNARTADGGAATYNASFGAATSSSSRFAISNDGSTSARHDNGKCISVCASGSTPLCAADFVSFDADGFTVNWTTVSSGVVVNYLALGGADLTNAAIKQFNSATATGNQATTGVGFKPDTVLFFSLGNATAPPATLSTGLPVDLGWMTSAAQGSHSFNGSGGAAINAYQRTASAFAGTSATSKVLEAAYTSLDSDGFTINWSSVLASGRVIWALCLKGGQYAVGAFNKPTSTGNSGVTGVGFTPSAEAFLSFGVVAGTTVNTAGRSAFGAATGTSNRGSIAVSIEGTNTTNKYLTRTRALRIDGDGTAAGEADFISHDADGFTLNWTTADATAEQVLYFAAGNAAAVPATVNAPVATATATALTPASVGVSVSVSVPVITATATSLTPTVTAAATVTAVIITATATVLTPTVTVPATITSVVATATTTALAPSITAAVSVASVVATATATTLTPQAQTAVAIASVVATATGNVLTAAFTAGWTLSAAVATATADGLVPRISDGHLIWSNLLMPGVGAIGVPQAVGVAATARPLSAGSGTALRQTLPGVGGTARTIQPGSGTSDRRGNAP